MENFTPIASLAGGAIIGLAAALILIANGRIAGISGIFAGILQPSRGEFSWRAAFVGGLVAGGAVLVAFVPELFAVTVERSPLLVVAAGLLVGFGTQLGSGCTSGHGVCGLARLSTRSLVATVSFIATGIATVWVANLTSGGAL